MSQTQKPQFEHHESIEKIPVASSITGHHHEEIAMPPSNAAPAYPSTVFKFGNPAALGFASFATGSLVMGLYSIGLLTNLPQVVVGVALGYTGIGQWVSGFMELLMGNTYAATTMMVIRQQI
jgi:succinate-acetate transporter protein